MFNIRILGEIGEVINVTLNLRIPCENPVWIRVAGEPVQSTLRSIPFCIHRDVVFDLVDDGLRPIPQGVLYEWY